MAQAVMSRQAAPEGFDQVPVLRHRLYLNALFSPNTLAVYDALKSMVWREEAYGPERLREGLKQGFLVATADYQKLSLMTGVGRGRIQDHLRKLEHAGWLVPHRQGPRANIYELGVRKENRSGCAERPYADDVMVKWFDAATAFAQSTFKKQWKSCTEDEKFASAKYVVTGTYEAPKSDVEPKDFRRLRGVTQFGLKSKKPPMGASKKPPMGTVVEAEISRKPAETLEKKEEAPAAIYNEYNIQVLHFVQEVSYRNLLLSVQNPLSLRCTSPASQVSPAGSLRSPAGDSLPACEFAARLDEVCDPLPGFPSSAAHRPALPSSAVPLPPRAAPAYRAFAFALASLSEARVTGHLDSSVFPPSLILEAADGPPNENEAPTRPEPLPDAERRS